MNYSNYPSEILFARKDAKRQLAAHRMKRIEKMTRDRLKDNFTGVLYDEHGTLEGNSVIS